MKYSRSSVTCKTHSIPQLKFETQTLSSFSGLVIFHQLFLSLKLSQRIGNCLGQTGKGKIYTHAKLFLQLIIHLLLGYRELRDCQYYCDDPLVQRMLELKRLPDVATLSRMLQDADEESVNELRRLMNEMVIERLKALGLRRITLDFDGSVQSTSRRAEGTAVGFNKKKKGARSYYPLFCTVAQTGQVLDFLHRSGNVHDSNRAKEFILSCIEEISLALGHSITLECRTDSAFFSDELVSLLDTCGVEYTISVPFERFVELKAMIEARRRWHCVSDEISYFERQWKPKCWERDHRFLFVRTLTKKQHKDPVQLDLFIPYEHDHEFKVILTNKATSAGAVLDFHNGRGSQEGIFAELKTNCHMGYVPVRKCNGNQIYLLAGLFAHNLARELQMRSADMVRGTTINRAALWAFEKLSTVRGKILMRAGRLTRPAGRLTLVVSGNQTIKERFLEMLERLAA